jgi:hypothetical protein
MSLPHIQVVLADERIPAPLQAALTRVKATAAFWSLPEALTSDLLAHADAVVVVLPEETGAIDTDIERLFNQLARRPRATLVLTADGEPAPQLPCPATVPVSFFSGADVHDLSGRLTTMLAVRGPLDSLTRRMEANRQSGESIARQYARQLRLASQVQREFLPERMPDVPRAAFHVVFEPVDFVSGDIYDVQPLDDEHVAIAIADATGHGIPAALLTVYIKRALRGKEFVDGAYRIIPPAEVLRRLNEDLLDAHLTECQFVAATYGVLNLRTLELTIARGGAPFPLLRERTGDVTVLTNRGNVVGVLPESDYEQITVQLRPGDSLLFYSDGLERVVAPESADGQVPAALRAAAGAVDHVDLRFDVDPPAPAETDDSGVFASSLGGPTLGTALTLAGAVATTHRQLRVSGPTPDALDDPVLQSPWLQTLQMSGVGVALRTAQTRQRALRDLGYPLDDLTMISLEIAP